MTGSVSERADRLLVPKSRTKAAGGEGGFDRDRLLRALFTLPVPPPLTTNKCYPITTPLGRLMRHRQLLVRELAAKSGVDARYLSDYLASRRPIPERHRVMLAEVLGVDARLL